MVVVMFRTWAFVLAAIVVLVSVIGSVTGSDDGAEIVRKKQDRTLYVEQDTFFSSINSYSKDDKAPWFEFHVNAHRELEVGASYGFKDRPQNNVGMGIKFMGLVEYRDTNGDSVYDERTEKVASFYPLSGSAYSSDYVRKEGPDASIGEETTWIHNGSMDWAYADAFQRGFARGWDLGFRAGSDDFQTDAPWSPDILSRIPREQQEGLRLEMEKALSVNDYSEEIHDWLLNGSIQAIHMGFKRAYLEAYPDSSSVPVKTSGQTADEKADPSGGTRGETASMYPVKYERPVENVVSMYRPLRVYKEQVGDATNNIIEIWDNSNIFGLKCIVSNEFVVSENGYISPASIKIDIMIKNYPFTVRDTKLALITEMGSVVTYTGDVSMERMDQSYDQSRGLTTDEEEVRFQAGNFSGFFSWVKTAKADMVDIPVNTRITSSVYGSAWSEMGGRSENHRGVVFCYPRARSIVHDPKLGFIEIEKNNVYVPFKADEVLDALDANPALYGIGILVVAAAVALTWKRRGPSR